MAHGMLLSRPLTVLDLVIMAGMLVVITTAYGLVKLVSSVKTRRSGQP